MHIDNKALKQNHTDIIIKNILTFRHMVKRIKDTHPEMSLPTIMRMF